VTKARRKQARPSRSYEHLKYYVKCGRRRAGALFFLETRVVDREESLEMATRTDSRKHAARARRLQGEVLAANGKFEEAAGVLDSSVALARELKAAQDLWQGCIALGKVLLKLEKESEAEAQFTTAARTIEAIAQNLKIPNLRRSFLSARPVLDVYALLHRPPPQLC
jgi:hypothetical protein